MECYSTLLGFGVLKVLDDQLGCGQETGIPALGGVLVRCGAKLWSQTRSVQQGWFANKGEGGEEYPLRNKYYI